MSAKLLQFCLILCDPMDCSPPSSSVHGIIQARILEWIARRPPGDLSDPGIKPESPSLAGGFFTTILAFVGNACSVWATLGLLLLTACVLSQSTLLRLQFALQANCLRWALGYVFFPGLSHSGSGSWVLHKGTDSVGPAFGALPRSERLR